MSVVRIWGVDAGDFVQGKLVWSALNALRPAKVNPPEVVDLSDLQLCRPYTLAAIAALGCLAGGTARLVLPVAQDVRKYVVRSGLPQFFVSPDNEDDAPASSARIVPVRQLQSVSPTFADEVVRAWELEFQSLPPGLRSRFADHIDEVVRNALSHADSAIGCIVAATVYPQNRRGGNRRPRSRADHSQPPHEAPQLLRYCQ